MSASTFEAMEKAVKEHKGNLSAAAQALGIPRETFRQAYLKKRGVVGRWPGVPSKREKHTSLSMPKGAAGRSIQEFRAQHDKSYIVPRKIKEGLTQLGKGWEYETAFARLCGVSLTDLGNYRDMFADHVIALRRDGKRAWAGTKATAEAMKEMLS